MNNKRQNPMKFRPKAGKVYENAGGGLYRCDAWKMNGRGSEDPFTAWMQNTVSGWTLLAHNIVQYEDGTIEWDYSTHGRFEPLPEEEAEIRSRQRSILNAMLCCLI